MRTTAQGPRLGHRQGPHHETANVSGPGNGIAYRSGHGPGRGSRGSGYGPGPHPGHGGPGHRSGGVPDGLLLALLGLLLCLTVLTWTSTGLAGLFSHGSWPTGVTFPNTPSALRHLVTDPQNLVAAWPAAPPAALSGYGLFWGLLISQFLVLIVLTIFVMGVFTRWRLVRARAREDRLHARTSAHEAPSGTAPTAPTAPTAGPTGIPTAPASPMGGGTAQSASERTSPDRADPRPWEGTGPGRPPTEQHLAPPPAPSIPAPSPGPGPAATAGAANTPATSDAAVATTPATSGAAPAATRTLTGPGPLLLNRATHRPTAFRTILEAPGPALVLTSDPTLWEETKDSRAKLGPVLLYDPEHRCDTPARLHWSPTARCEDPAVAAARAAALLAPVRPHAKMDAALAETAETLLASWLHAAAIDGRPFRQLLRWAQGTHSHEAVRILRTHPRARSGAAGLLESALTAYPERRDQAQQLTLRTFAALSSIHIRDACTPNRTDSLTLESFADEGGTLYLVGEAIEDPRTRPTGPGAMPLLTALASDVVEHGRRMAARSSDGRLDPPMTLVLDDVAAVAPLPQLPELLANGQGQGLPTLALLRSQEQFNSRWPRLP